ncbi:DUF3696 domain-containing protein [Variovorax sp. J22R133]|uniref:AAA family ATPase n=1 Tax=Variovorax brevis TaxID=3053503 RepID=UPI0025759B10|nr:DUF3696 domain-containing protein [Variovorax sp. J22R133]MDM0116145.1 DUF3696 domain-containing protein [Variovorax sp. J22R133]
MIEQWTLQNFKSVRDERKLDFKPLTLFVGQNSAGKSTIIQSILLTAQTLQNSAGSKSLVLNGRIVRLGSFVDIRSNHAQEAEIGIEFRLKESPYLKKGTTEADTSPYSFTQYWAQMAAVEAKYTFSAGPPEDMRKHLLLQPQLEEGRISYFSVERDQSAELAFQRHGRTQVAELERLKVLAGDVNLVDPSAIEFAIKDQTSGYRQAGDAASIPQQAIPAGVVLRHFIPTATAVVYDAIAGEVEAMFELLSDISALKHRRREHRLLAEALSTSNFRAIAVAAYRNATERLPTDLKSRASDAISDLESDFNLINLAKAQTSLRTQGKAALLAQLTKRSAEIKSLLRSGREQRKEISAVAVSDALTFAGDYIFNFFSHRIKYLGPLRDEPKAIYPLSGYNEPNEIGFKGEFTAAVLENNKATPVWYIPSTSFPFSATKTIERSTCELAVAVRDWLGYLGIATGVGTEDKGKLGHELTIATSSDGFLHDLTHVGVGVSQALPIVVSSLLAENGTTLVFEQPELHLNPKVQSRLADFFVSLILCGKQCIVETHSEYLISRLRYLTVAAKDESIASHIKIFFVEKRSDQSFYRDVEVSDRGVILDWPDGFFDEADRNASDIIQAQIDFARKSASNRSSGAK